MLCPAKINLGLSVFHRRADDGRHYLATIFVPVSFGDGAIIETADSDSFVSTNLLPPHCAADFEVVSERGDLSGNLLWQILQTIPGPRAGVRIELTKRIPTGAGLGGGSSNAAALLRFLIERGDLHQDQARRLAAQHGADIAFFLEHGPQLAFGIGERLQPIALAPAHGVLCLPPVRSATGAAYSALKRPLQATPAPESWPSLDEHVREALATGRWRDARQLTNDFEEAVFRLYPELDGIKQNLLRAGAAYASLSGSGAALFALTGGDAESAALAKSMRSLEPRTDFVTFTFAGGGRN